MTKHIYPFLDIRKTWCTFSSGSIHREQAISWLKCPGMYDHLTIAGTSHTFFGIGTPKACAPKNFQCLFFLSLGSLPRAQAISWLKCPDTYVHLTNAGPVHAYFSKGTSKACAPKNSKAHFSLGSICVMQLPHCRNFWNLNKETMDFRKLHQSVSSNSVDALFGKILEIPTMDEVAFFLGSIHVMQLHRL